LLYFCTLIKITCKCLMASLYDSFRVSVSVSTQRSCVRVIRAWLRFFRSFDICSSNVVLFASAIWKEHILCITKENYYSIQINDFHFHPQLHRNPPPPPPQSSESETKARWNWNQWHNLKRRGMGFGRDRDHLKIALDKHGQWKLKR
jgi:hypothetical protein